MTIGVSERAPEFVLKDETGELTRLYDFKNQPVVLYFYPKDDTPGCTTEACEFRDDFSEYIKAGVVVLGISPDSPNSHLKFKKKYSLPFRLLADEDHSVCEAYGVWGLKKMYGKEYFGVLRTTFLISPDGLIKAVFENVKPKGHSKEILAALK
ncbi:MAG: thioredoxin-dependent thiol peroxidase [Chloroflexi bacterium HGW-Chloroflexi-10]|jgi:peroxiredoxin Q/BCP|nr:MAG: thioredoxin-dependent thiol peroxidase [Chloroflexi bacterium HGW-Chloroflexi-10]